MTTGETHKKHATLQRAGFGYFGRNEVAICGTTCEEVHRIADSIRAALPSVNIAFADADHAAEHAPIAFSFQQKGNFFQLIKSVDDNNIQKQIGLYEADLVLVNGNHFEAASQIIICNEAKENSLRKRAAQLTNVKAIWLKSQNEVPAYVKELVGNWQSLPIFTDDALPALSDFLRREYLQPAPLHALIMAGGRSTRMGEDKSLIAYHNIPQHLYLKNIFDNMHIPAFISCRAEQTSQYAAAGHRVIEDKIIGIGPMGGIASAFMHYPDAAWLVVACDIPLADEPLFTELIAKRRPQQTATCYESPHDKMPEPLIAIWEPKSYMQLMQCISLGYTCPRKVLLNSHVQMVSCSTGEKLLNVNTQEEKKLLATR